MSKIRGLPKSDLSDEIQELRMSQEGEQSSTSSWTILSVIKNREFLLPLLLMCSMQAGQQFSGINAVSTEIN